MTAFFFLIGRVNDSLEGRKLFLQLQTLLVNEVGPLREIGIMVGVVFVVSLFTGTGLAGNVGSRISHGAGMRDASHGNRQFVNQHNRSRRHRHSVKPRHPNHKSHRSAKHRDPGRNSNVLISYYYPTGSYLRLDYSYENGEDEQGNDPVASSDLQEDSPDASKEMKEPLPPHIETIDEGDTATTSTYKTIPSRNAGAHIVVYGSYKESGP